MIYEIWTDGSGTYKFDKKGGIGIYIVHNKQEIFIRKGFKNTTVYRMEVMALLFALKYLPKETKKAFIYIDNKAVSGAISERWLWKWKRQKFEGRKSADLWKQILKEIEKRPNLKLHVSHVHGHQKDISNKVIFGNHVADILANYHTQKSYHLDIPQ